MFGGVSPAGFVANDDMRARCSGGQSGNMETLRSEVRQALAGEVVKIPSIKAVHEVN